MTNKEKHALVEAAAKFEDGGFEFRMPWEGTLDNRERELFEALVRACRAYHETMNND